MDSRPVALITGASRGIGAATARKFATGGYDVALVAFASAELEAVAEELRAAGGEALMVAGDLSDLEFVKAAVDRTVERWGRVDVLVNNAASRELASLRRTTASSWNHTLQVCLTAPAFLARYCAESMEQQSRGVIVNVSSVMSRQAMGISPAYVASKGGLESLTIELAALYGVNGVRVVCVGVGAVDTDLSQDLAANNEAQQELRRYSEDMIMLGRWAQPEEIARTIYWLASDDASYITATTITVDGGWRGQHAPTSLKRAVFPEDYP